MWEQPPMSVSFTRYQRPMAFPSWQRVARTAVVTLRCEELLSVSILDQPTHHMLAAPVRYYNLPCCRSYAFLVEGGETDGRLQINASPGVRWLSPARLGTEGHGDLAGGMPTASLLLPSNLRPAARGCGHRE